jgi:hypothetical protein
VPDDLDDLDGLRPSTQLVLVLVWSLSLLGVAWALTVWLRP